MYMRKKHSYLNHKSYKSFKINKYRIKDQLRFETALFSHKKEKTTLFLL